MSPRHRAETRPGPARPRRAFWVLLAIAVLAMGSLSSSLARPPGTWTGLTVAASGVVLLLASTLACRVMLALERRRRRESAGGGEGSSRPGQTHGHATLAEAARQVRR